MLGGVADLRDYMEFAKKGSATLQAREKENSKDEIGEDLALFRKVLLASASSDGMRIPSSAWLSGVRTDRRSAPGGRGPARGTAWTGKIRWLWNSNMGRSAAKARFRR